MLCLALRKLNGWLQTISPNKVKPEIREKVVQYQEECDDVPDALYLGIYEGVMLVGVHEVRPFWMGVVECHAIYAPDFRGRYALEGHRLFCLWLL